MSNPVKEVKVRNAPAPIGWYAQATIAGDFVFVAGQIALNPATGKLIKGGIRKQTEKILDNIEKILEGAGTNLSRVCSTTVYLTNLDDWPILDRVYRRVFEDLRPARSTIEGRRLNREALVEISCIAYLR